MFLVTFRENFIEHHYLENAYAIGTQTKLLTDMICLRIVGVLELHVSIARIPQHPFHYLLLFLDLLVNLFLYLLIRQAPPQDLIQLFKRIIKKILRKLTVQLIYLLLLPSLYPIVKNNMVKKLYISVIYTRTNK